MGARPANPGEPIQDRRMIVLTSRGVILVFTKEGEGLLGDVPGISLATHNVGSYTALECIVGGPVGQDRALDSLKEKPSKFDLRGVIRCDVPKGVEVKSLVAYGKVWCGEGWGGGGGHVWNRNADTLPTHCCCVCVRLGVWCIWWPPGFRNRWQRRVFLCVRED